MQFIASQEPFNTQLAHMDWHAAWWQPWQAAAQGVATQVAQGAALHDALNAHAHGMGQPACFVTQSALQGGVAYEHYIFNSGQRPTRHGFHDFFNGLAWLNFPLTKARLNALQAGEINAHGIQGTRGPLRDALTLFDESAAVLHCSDALWQALATKQWRRAFIDLRHEWIDPQRTQLVVFGHALLEKLVSPYKSITAQLFRAQAATQSIADLDTQLAHTLAPHALVPKPFIPLPVLGVPGWWAANEQAGFYDDNTVFRTPRVVAMSTMP
jgi:Protein of unknown function (DUF3025)